MSLVFRATLVGCLLVTLTTAAETTPGTRLQTQRQAHDMARQLVAEILDIQIRQLEENGLQRLPIHREVVEMRNNVGALIDRQMQSVISGLERAEQADAATRPELIASAREDIRQIVTVLIAERQKLRRRWKITQFATEVRELIKLQRSTHTATQSLPELPSRQRAGKTLTVTEDQRDVQILYLKLVETLNDIGSWGGEVGAGATEGARVLRAANVEQEISAALQHLLRLNWPEATSAQLSVIRGLEALLQQIDAAQGLAAADQQAALRLVREIKTSQEELRETTRDTKLDEESIERLVNSQAAIYREMRKLEPSLSQKPSAQNLLEQAKSAAYQAAADLFQLKSSPADEQQARVAANLAEIESRLQRDLSREETHKSADELAEDLSKLEALAKEIQTIATAQRRIKQIATSDPQRSQSWQEQVATRLEQNQQAAEDWPTIASRQRNASEAARQAAKVLSENNTAADEPRAEATEAVRDALRHAMAEIQAEQADTQRRQLAVAVGELARAAEAIERTAAAESRIAEAAQRAQDRGQPLATETVETMRQENQVAARATDLIAEGSKFTAPEAQPPLEQAAAEMQRLDSLLSAKDGKDGKEQTPRNVKEVAQQAADRLADAAAELRAKAGSRAKDWPRWRKSSWRRYPRRVHPWTNWQRSPDAPLEEMNNLRDSSQQVERALIEQLRAAGRPAAAKAATLAAQVDRLREAQQAAARASEELAAGRAVTPLEAALKQQSMADAAEKIASKAPPNIQPLLKQAAGDASKAAQQTLENNPELAERYRQQADEALQKASQLIQQDLEAALKLPPKSLDAAAQARVGGLVRQAASLTEEFPEINDKLEAAEDESDKAQTSIKQEDQEAAQQEQQQVAQALEESREEIEKLMQELTERTNADTQQRAERSGQLAEELIGIDPDAAAAVEHAARTTDRPPPDDDASTAQAAAEQVQADIERASASLGAREQQLARDKEIAEAMATLAEQQQAAREQIESLSDQLNETSEEAGETGETESSETAEVAKALEEATREFADAQQATGQGAETISEQQEVANEALREGLETASQLQPCQACQGASPSEGNESGTSSSSSNSTGEASAASSAEDQSGTGEQSDQTGSSPASSELTGDSSAATSGNDQSGAREPSDQTGSSSASADSSDRAGENPSSAGASPDQADSSAAPSDSGDEAPPASSEEDQDGVTPSDQSNASETSSDSSQAATLSSPSESQADAGALPRSSSDPSADSPPPEPAGEQGGEGQSSGPGESTVPGSDGQPSSASAEPGSADDRSDAMGTASADGQMADGSSDMGTGLVPNSPLTTAEAIAGPLAMAAAQKALAAQQQEGSSQEGQESKEDNGQGTSGESGAEGGQPNQSSSPTLPGEGEGSASGSGGSQDGRSGQQNQSMSDESQDSSSGSDSDSGPGTGDRNIKISAHRFDGQAWFAKLPPTLREAIQAKAARRPPRGYEERLRRYFENTD